MMDGFVVRGFFDCLGFRYPVKDIRIDSVARYAKQVTGTRITILDALTVFREPPAFFCKNVHKQFHNFYGQGVFSWTMQNACGRVMAKKPRISQTIVCWFLRMSSFFNPTMKVTPIR